MVISLRMFAPLGALLFSLGVGQMAHAADPPERVMRLSHTEGELSYSPAGEDVWLSVVRNRPLISGDRLWSDHDARAELQVGSAAIRLGPDTSFEILDLNDRLAQLQLTQGTLNLRVRRLYPGQSYEVATPTLAFTITRAGRYRIDVDPRDDQTTIVVWEGAGEAYGDNASFPLRTGDVVRFYDTDLRDYEMYGLPRADAFDRYCLERDQRLDRSASLRYVDDDVVGYADLDEYGSWRTVRNYGSVWFPSRVDVGWAPYREGHWVWQEPWGWTWVDDAPWAFAPSHYGRWVSVSSRWGWIPGPRNVRPVYAPALVAFVGGSGWSVSLSLGSSAPIGWFPLGPREIYVPSYQASRDYFTRVNVNNTVINNTDITNVYNNYSSGNINVTQVSYANRTVTGAVTAVPREVFVNARPVRSAALRLDRNAANTGEITRVAPIAPKTRSVTGAGVPAKVRPARAALERPVVARNAPPAQEHPFAAREPQLQRTPGRALESAAAAKPRQNVHVVIEQRGNVDVRAAGSRRDGRESGAAATPSQLKPLNRERRTESVPNTAEQPRQRQTDPQNPDNSARPITSPPKTAVRKNNGKPDRDSEKDNDDTDTASDRKSNSNRR